MFVLTLACDLREIYILCDLPCAISVQEDMDDSPRLNRLEKTNEKKLQSGYSRHHVSSRQGHCAPRDQNQRHFKSKSRERNELRKAARQARWSKQLRLPTHEDQLDTSDHYHEEKCPWYKLEEKWKLEYYEELLQEWLWWECWRVPGWMEYKEMIPTRCPLCGGDCMHIVKREVQNDVTRKWR
jgi:hypothetical protein